MYLFTKGLNAGVIASLHVEMQIEHNLPDHIDRQASSQLFKSKDIRLLRMLIQLLDVDEDVVDDARDKSHQMLCRESRIEHCPPPLPELAVARDHVVAPQKWDEVGLHCMVFLWVVFCNLLTDGWIHDRDEGVSCNGPDVHEDDGAQVELLSK